MPDHVPPVFVWCMNDSAHEMKWSSATVNVPANGHSSNIRQWKDGLEGVTLFKKDGYGWHWVTNSLCARGSVILWNKHHNNTRPWNIHGRALIGKLPADGHIVHIGSWKKGVWLVKIQQNREFTGHLWIPRTQRPVTRSVAVFFYLRLNKRLSKHSWGWWFETHLRSLWRHSSVYWISYNYMIDCNIEYQLTKDCWCKPCYYKYINMEIKPISLKSNNHTINLVKYVSLQWRHNGRDGVSNIPVSLWFTQPFIGEQIKENIKAPRHLPLCGEFTGDRWIPRTKGQWRGKWFYLMTSSCVTTACKRFNISDPYKFIHHWYQSTQDLLEVALENTISGLSSIDSII